MLRATARPSLIEVDNKTLLYSVYMAFEGRYEDGLAGFSRLRQRYPRYPQFVRPFAFTLPFTPRDYRKTIDMIDGVLAKVDRGAWYSRAIGSCEMLRFSGAYANRFYNPDEATRQFRAIVSDDPEHPDWIVSYANFELARQLAARGDVGAARSHLRAVLDDDAGSYLHSEPREMLRALDDDYAPSEPSGIDLAAVYSGDPDALSGAIERLRSHEPATVQTDFYLGDALLLSGDVESALESYRAAVAREVPAWDESFQMIACSRLAEIHGSRLQFEEATDYMDMAMDFYHKEFLYDWLLEGRKRYFGRIASGEDHSTPTLFSSVP
jgi:tetratricopeptide (TPR) repeat protein